MLSNVVIPANDRLCDYGRLEQIKQLLAIMFPSCDYADKFDDSLPLVKWNNKGGSFEVYLLCKQRPGVVRFFQDMVTEHTLSSKILDINGIFSSDFFLPNVTDGLLTVASIFFKIDPALSVTVDKALEKLQKEICVGAVSSYYATQILNFKGISADQKINIIQNKIHELVKCRYQEYDRNMIAQMQRFLLLCSEEFKNGRDYHHIVRIIAIFYKIRQWITKQQTIVNKRWISIKCLPTALSQGAVLGIVIGFNVMHKHELCEEKHIFDAIKKCIPNAELIPGSFFSERSGDVLVQLSYLEIKSSCDRTSIDIIRTRLPFLLKERIVCLVHPLFMPRNDEELFKNMVLLSKELRFIKDIPQVIITFDGQKEQEIFFTAIILRLLTEEAVLLENVLNKLQKNYNVTVERIKTFGTLRRKYVRQALVLRFVLKVTEHVKHHTHVDLYKARYEVYSHLKEAFGTIRDYNGSMIEGQNRHFEKLKKALKKNVNDELLESFFFSIIPGELRSVFNVELLKTFFLSFVKYINLEGFYGESGYRKRDANYLIFILHCNAHRFNYIKQRLASYEQILIGCHLRGDNGGLMVVSNDAGTLDAFERDFKKVVS